MGTDGRTIGNPLTAFWNRSAIGLTLVTRFKDSIGYDVPSPMKRLQLFHRGSLLSYLTVREQHRVKAA